ncbi:hypothetical protein COP2_025289 [Malus domestica]
MSKCPGVGSPSKRGFKVGSPVNRGVGVVEVVREEMGGVESLEKEDIGGDLAEEEKGWEWTRWGSKGLGWSYQRREMGD